MSVWMLTHTGRDHYLSGSQALFNRVDIYDVAHALAQINRFTGHCKRPYSVAEHSLLCADLANRDGHGPVVQLACLMHDAHEAFSGDTASPAKHAIGLGWATFEHLQADTLRRQFGLQTAFAAHKALVNHYDLVALATERRDLMNFTPGRNQLWPIDQPGERILPAEFVNLQALHRIEATWSTWRDEFLQRFSSLIRDFTPPGGVAHQPA